MLDPNHGSTLLDCRSSTEAWASHLAGVGRQGSQAYDEDFFDQISTRVERLWDQSASGGQLDYEFVEADLLQARSQVSRASSTGCDNLPYDVWCVDCAVWNDALLSFFNLLLRWGVVPDLWRMGIVIPLPKEGDLQLYGNWRPITLLSCMGKFFEGMLLPRLKRQLDGQLSRCQAGFRYGADEQAYCLVEALRIRRSFPARERQTFVAFIDVRKAYDTVWRGGLLHQLWSRGIRGSLWRVCASLLTRTSARVRLPTGYSPVFSEESGVRQG